MSICSGEEARLCRVPGPVQEFPVPFMLRVLDGLQQFRHRLSRPIPSADHNLLSASNRELSPNSGILRSA